MTQPWATADYWESLYRAGDTGWDKGRVAPPIARLLSEGHVAKGGRVAVIGAGRGHEAVAAAKAGFAVTGVDFAPSAAQAMREAGVQAGARFEVLQADLFELPSLRAEPFDAVLEHTCFCAIPVERREAYVQAVRAVLEPNGLLLGLFYAHGRPDGPPFDTSEAEVRRLFSPWFELERLRVASDSFENRAGKELEAVFRRR